MAKDGPTMKVDLSEFVPKLRKLSSAARGEALKDTVEAGARVIEANAKINANQVFSNNATNALANSITVEVNGSGNSVTANIGPTVIYGRIHELGGIIKPITAKMLSWISETGERVFAKVVHMPARPYLRPAVDGHEEDIRDAMAETLMRKIAEALR